jgi:hypothetical protein
MKFRNLDADQIAALNPRPYPGFPEYMLLDIPGGEADGFRRGATVENLEFPAADAWQRFLVDHYCPPDTGKLLVLHQCSWAKPYDLSATLQPVVKVCAKFKFVHRVVVSSIGLVPAELQLNPLFCSYDWISIDGQESPELIQVFSQTFANRLQRYICAHRDHYWGVLALAGRHAGSRLSVIAELTKEMDLPLFTVPDRAGWQMTNDRDYRDLGDRIRHPVVLEQLRTMVLQIAQTWSKLGLVDCSREFANGLPEIP